MMTACLGLTRIPCTMMRGGTSRGAYFLADDLPEEPELRDRVLLAAMGSPHPLQVDGIGGGNSLTSKVAIIGAPTLPQADIDYLFAQVSVTEDRVDTRASCGNLLAGVGPFAVEHGLVAAADGHTVVRINNANTGVLCEAAFATPGGMVTYGGEERIDGAPGQAAPVRLTYLNAQGAITGALLPSGQVSEDIDGIRVTLIDYSIPVMLIAAADLGLTGQETPAAISADAPLLARIERMRREAGLRMGLGDVGQRVSPKVALLAPPCQGGTITSRYLTPWACHTAHAVTGGMAIAVACTLEGTAATRVIGRPVAAAGGTVRLEHPSGSMEIVLSVGEGANAPRTSIVRTARKLFQGEVLIPQAAWPGARPFAHREAVQR